MSKILREGRLSPVRKDVIEFTSSIRDDTVLLDAVVKINTAHVIMLTKQKIIKPDEGAILLQALITDLNIKLDASSEDVHMAVEEAVLGKIGAEIGGNLHIAKSRNDQVATAIRMALRQKLLDLMSSVAELQESLIQVSEKHLKTVILAYTHVQPAQPVTFAHYLLSRFDALSRDLQRLQSVYARVNLSPMGAGALATTSFPIDRKRVCELLGFGGLVENSIDAVGSRDFVLETNAVLTLIALNLSQIAEDLILWSSPDFGVIELPDDFTSTSSMMPQKKNPEVPEIVRARAAHVLGDFVASAAAMKNMPSTYNLDYQEVTPKLWSAMEAVKNSVTILAQLFPHLKVTSDISAKASANFVAATELANVLVRDYHVPFRSAHKIVGSLVKSLLAAKQTLADLTPELIRKTAKSVADINLSVKSESLVLLSNPLKLVESHKVTGGPAPSEVKRALLARKKGLISAKSCISKMQRSVDEAEVELEQAAGLISRGEAAIETKLKDKKQEVE
jgi:argininosuccinate lyase